MAKSRNSVSGAGPLKSTGATYAHNDLSPGRGAGRALPQEKLAVYISATGVLEGPSS